MSQRAKIALILGFISAVTAFSLYPYLWRGAFYDLTALSFTCYTGALYLQTRGEWSLVCFVVWLTTVSSLIEEIVFDPLAINYNEFISFFLITLIVCKFKDKWTR